VRWRASAATRRRDPPPQRRRRGGHHSLVGSLLALGASVDDPVQTLLADRGAD
jgi:hypothetical protein